MVSTRALVGAAGFLVASSLSSCATLPIENTVWQQILASVTVPTPATSRGCISSYPISSEVRRLLLSPNLQVYRYSLSLSSEEREMQFDVRIDQVFLSVKSLLRGDTCLSFTVNFVSTHN